MWFRNFAAMIIEENKSLKSLNTFSIEAKGKWFAEIKSLDDFNELVKTELFIRNERLILGGGSNILFTKDFDGFVIKNSLGGKKIIEERRNNKKTYTCKRILFI